jgi:hypothetical protein
MIYTFEAYVPIEADDPDEAYDLFKDLTGLDMCHDGQVKIVTFD